MKKLHAPNHKFYEQYYVDQAKQKGGNLAAFHGARFQRTYGLATGSIFKGLFRRAMPHLQQGAKVIRKKLYKRVSMSPKMFLMEITLKRQSANRLNKPSVYLPRIHCGDNRERAKKL